MERDHLIKFWKNFDEDLKEFKYNINIPHDKEAYDLCVKALIRCGAIPKKDLKVGQYYRGKWRGGYLGKWLGEKFEMYRREWAGGKNYYWGNMKANHFEDDDKFALMIPIEEITEEEYNRLKEEEMK